MPIRIRQSSATAVGPVPDRQVVPLAVSPITRYKHAMPAWYPVAPPHRGHAAHDPGRRMYSAVLVLEPAAAEFGTGRGAASAYAL